MEADHVVREQAVVDRLPHRLRQDVPVIRLRPGDVDEVGEQRVGDPLTDETGREVQVVVVEKDRRVRVELQLLDDRIREALVDARIAFVPRLFQRDVDRGRVGELPEVVLEEPEDRVRDDVVEPVVRRLVVGDEPQAEGCTALEGLLDRLAARLLDHRAVLFAHRARDPRDVVVRDEAAQRGDEPAAAAPGHALVAVAPVRDRTAVGDDDQLPAPGPHGGDPNPRGAYETLREPR